ncbi:hypothetical protein [Desulfurococcus amylolyticus]|uniref:Uncharacterized protein n=1 Tax=Desulfurococcus amylolyticus (strain DSM 18924 / JCM 16383 / VKM B-2413 / 1221n) TaxID=490899 RepID=B8D3A4_DESA1|nr:hypothetical protein [Desulfurococcus amylolyticus]ACL10375.1 hypothetical protein DKAM_0046 [Desulfurococcus amylolyticus 1221n]
MNNTSSERWRNEDRRHYEGRGARYEKTGHHGSYASTRFQHLEEKRLEPQPIGDKCNPLCPFFTCNKNALMITSKPVRGKMIRVAQCRLIGGDCINGECQYASCRLNSLLPDGRCAKALERKIKQSSDEEMFKQMKQFEDYDVSDFIR